MSLLALLPLIFTVVICVTAAMFAMKRKSLAQAICVQHVARMQRDLKAPLKKLLSMNRRAESLRARRQHADNSVRAATGTPALPAALAVQTEVILEQTEFHFEQLALLAEAARIRAQSELELQERAGQMQALDVHGQSFYHRALAVEPRPPFDLSPNYETIPGFTSAQQHRFSYQVNVLENFPRAFEKRMPLVQQIECAASLEERSGDWDLKILTARAL